MTAGLSGTVVEIWFGSGLNMPIYPAEVHLVYAVDPALTARRLAEERMAASHVVSSTSRCAANRSPSTTAAATAPCRPSPSARSPGVDAAPGEIRRVLRPGGRFHFLEHGLSPDPGLMLRCPYPMGLLMGRSLNTLTVHLHEWEDTWQRRFEPLHERVADGSHLTRDPTALVRGAGFEIERVESR